MGKVNRHIEIVSSSKSVLSSMSQASRDAAAEVLSRHYRQVGITLVDDMHDLEALVAKAPDLVLLGMKFIPASPLMGTASDQKVWLADYLAERGIATTGSQSTAHSTEVDKHRAKQRVKDAGLDTSAFCIIKAGQSIDPTQLPSSYPLFVKPADRGGGVGIDSDSVVHNLAQLERKVGSISHRLNSDSLVETYLPGREFSVAVLKDDDRGGLLGMPLELVAPPDERGARILSRQVKSADAEQVIAVKDDELRHSVVGLAVSAFEAIGGRDYGRIDIRMDGQGVPHFLEANLIPSLIDNYGSFPKACALNEAINYEDMLIQIIELGLTRSIPVEKRLPLTLHREAIQSVGM